MVALLFTYSVFCGFFTLKWTYKLLLMSHLSFSLLGSINVIFVLFIMKW